MKKNVLVFPCGSEIGLEISRALADSTHFNLYGANNTDDHGKFVYANYIEISAGLEDPDFIDEINAITEMYQIDFIIPAHDTAVTMLADRTAELHAELITSSAETCAICRSKSATYERFSSELSTPKLYEPHQVTQYPVFLKPDVGPGSRGTYLAKDAEEMNFYLKAEPSLLVSEYLPGKEYTIDCFTNKKGHLLFAEGRVRNRISNGISVNSWHVKNIQFQEMARVINHTLNFRGVWFFQVKERSSGELVLMEISPRIAGTTALLRSAGVNFILLSLYDRMNYDVNIIHHDFHVEIDRALFSRYNLSINYEHVYVDFDDTIIIDNMVNTNLLKFLYQCKNCRKKLILITKHIHDIQQSLNKYAISPRLFDEIIQLTNIQQKINYIKNKNAIFIDDSFEERRNIAQSLHIPTFGLDAVESLMTSKV